MRSTFLLWLFDYPYEKREFGPRSTEMWEVIEGPYNNSMIILCSPDDWGPDYTHRDGARGMTMMD